jgi:hypothetical protein
MIKKATLMITWGSLIIFINKLYKQSKRKTIKNILVGILTFAFLIAIVSCSEEADPQFRIRNERSTKANVQVQTSGGNTININDVEAGQTTAFQTAAQGNVTATAVIQNESVSPTVKFFAAKDTRYSVVIRTGNVPSLRVDRE